MTYLDEVIVLMGRARNNLREAARAPEVGLYRATIALAYYAAFYAAKAVVAYHRQGPKTHEGVSRQFHKLAVLESDFPSTVAGLLDEMQEERLVADYDMSKASDDWMEEEALLAIDRATRFVDEVEGWLIRHLPPEARSNLPH
ncbi:MAG: HEPN domain-containing protein [bacterium]|nr:HEPN domain-containing protein [bacterium]MCY3652004.1 HEPN domain-containing protein [bacterium]MYD03977.1 HEPN domain-containing protein [Acidimicrobiia bacterium]